jgi:hypothetical protein
MILLLNDVSFFYILWIFVLFLNKTFYWRGVFNQITMKIYGFYFVLREAEQNVSSLKSAKIKRLVLQSAFYHPVLSAQTLNGPVQLTGCERTDGSWTWGNPRYAEIWRGKLG